MPCRTFYHAFTNAAMKFPIAILALTVGITGASAANRRSRRQAEVKGGAAAAAAAAAGKVPASNRARRQEEELECDDEELNGLVHLCFTGPDDNYAGDGGGNIGDDEVLPLFGGPPGGSTGFGGFAFEYDSDSQKVKFKGAAGSTFDFSSCMEYKTKRGDYGCNDRRMQEDTIEEDHHGGNYCSGDDTILYCPMQPGQCATFELTDTVEDCGMEFEEGGILLHVTTPGLSRMVTTNDNGGSVCDDEDAVAALQCAPNSDNEYMQTSECLYGDNNDDLGSTYGLSLRTCSIDGNTGPDCDCYDMIRPSSCNQYYIDNGCESIRVPDDDEVRF